MNPEDLVPEHVSNPNARPELEWSEYQKDIYEAVTTLPDNLSVEAVAGSGKTTTITHAMRILQDPDVMFLAFNRAIANTLAGRVPIGCEARTFNSLGHRLLTQYLRAQSFSPKLNQYKVWDIARSHMSDTNWEDFGRAVVQLVSLAKNAGFGISQTYDTSMFYELLDGYSIDIAPEFEDHACKLAQATFSKSIEPAEEFDFDDQLYMPVFLERNFPHYNCTMVDEAQDLTTIQHLMLGRLQDRGSRIIAVGDSYQAIYGFRGAKTDSMEALAIHFNMLKFPLSISYRCPKAVVRHAQLIVPYIKHSEDAIEGKVEHVEELPIPEEFPRHSMILCRNNGPGFRLALRFLKERLPCRLMSNMGKDLIVFVKKFKAKDCDDLSKKLSKWKDEQTLAAEARKSYGKIAFIQDKYDSLMPFVYEFQLVGQVTDALHTLLHGTTGPRISTIHKAKGLEAEHVYLLRPDLLPSKYAKSEEQLRQEANLKYVAITRALKTLTYLPEEEG